MKAGTLVIWRSAAFGSIEVEVVGIGMSGLVLVQLPNSGRRHLARLDRLTVVS